RFLCQDGSFSSQPVRFWSLIRRRATELLGFAADPARDYVMTEVVHCKSKNEMGVHRATAHCAQRHLDRVLAASDSNVVVVVGAKACDRARGLLDLPSAFGTKGAVGDEAANLATRDIGGRERVICYLSHPTSMVQAPRGFPGCYPMQLASLRAVANGHLA